MPIQYVCRKCGKTHSKDEYDQSKFCKSCGSFLLRTLQDERAALLLSQKSFERQAFSEINLKKSSSFKESLALTRAAESLRERIAGSKEYEVVSEKETEKERAQASASGSWIWNSEYDQALKLQRDLITKFAGKSLEDSMAGEVVSNEQGECYKISSTCTSSFKTSTYEESRQRIISDLKVLPGIGPVREQNLKQQGYGTIEDLENHPLWKKPASEFMKIINKKEIGSTQKWLWQRLPKSHPLLHYLAGFCQDQDFAIVDIETLGLSERPIILLGIAKPIQKSCLYKPVFTQRHPR